MSKVDDNIFFKMKAYLYAGIPVYWCGGQFQKRSYTLPDPLDKYYDSWYSSAVGYCFTYIKGLISNILPLNL